MKPMAIGRARSCGVAAALLVGCTVGGSDPPPVGVDAAVGGIDAAGGGGVDAPPGSGPSLQVTVTTTPNGGPYAPANVVAVWVEQGGTFVQTIDRWAAVRAQHLVAWNAAAGAGDTDAVSGATRGNHATPLTITWDLRDPGGAVVPDGTYTIRMELADSNANLATQNRQGTFTFVKGPSPQSQAGLSNGGFENVSITFTP
jgi:hypothetical protein